MEKKNGSKRKAQATSCESCVHYDYDEYTDSYVCTVNLDEDEYRNYLCGNCASCPYYHFYDEYKSVQRQN